MSDVLLFWLSLTTAEVTISFTSLLEVTSVLEGAFLFVFSGLWEGMRFVLFPDLSDLANDVIAFSTLLLADLLVRSDLLVDEDIVDVAVVTVPVVFPTSFDNGTIWSSKSSFSFFTPGVDLVFSGDRLRSSTFLSGDLSGE